MGFCQYPIQSWRKLNGDEMWWWPTMRVMAPPTSVLHRLDTDILYAPGYPIGALAVSTMSPMALLVFRFGLAGAILGGWALVARVTWPTGRLLAHVLFSGLLAQGLMYSTSYLALLPRLAVLGAVISMTLVVTAVLAALFLGERLTRTLSAHWHSACWRCWPPVQVVS